MTLVVDKLKGQNSKNNVVLDKYYTNTEIAKYCCSLFKNNTISSSNDICIEPSAGNGSFIAPIENMFKNCYFYDIYPENKKITKHNYLTLSVKKFVETGHKIHIIGNPPFGRKSSTAIQFIKKSEFADTIAFILPRSFKKNSLKKFFPPNFHLVHEYDIPKNSFYNGNKSFDVKCVFQIWVKKDRIRKIPENIIPIGYNFVKKEQNPNISITRVGFSTGIVSTNTKKKSEQSNYFIRFHNFSPELLNKLTQMRFETKCFTTGPRSISKQDIIKKINRIVSSINKYHTDL